jgi:hypothetical protein
MNLNIPFQQNSDCTKITKSNQICTYENILYRLQKSGLAWVTLVVSYPFLSYLTMRSLYCAGDTVMIENVTDM